jgi:ketosteroid isomerase-like protein
VNAAAVVERFNQAFDAQDVDAIMALMTQDCVFEDTTPPDGTRHVGPAAVRTAWEKLFASSAEIRFTTEEVVEAGDHVVVRWRYEYAGGHVRGVDLFLVRGDLVAQKAAYVKG